MPNLWHIARNGKKQFGPFSDQQLLALAQSRQLLPNDMVLLEGGQKWIPAFKIKGLFGSSQQHGSPPVDYPTALPAFPPPVSPNVGGLPLASAVPLQPPRLKFSRKQTILIIISLAFFIILFSTIGLRVFFWASTLGSGNSPNLTAPEQRSSPRGIEENLVAKFIQIRTNDPKSVEFVRWGPHGGGYDFEYLSTQPDKAIRCCFREKNDLGAMQFYDLVFFIRDGNVIQVLPNTQGDGWLEAMRRIRAAAGK